MTTHVKWLLHLIVSGWKTRWTIPKRIGSLLVTVLPLMLPKLSRGGSITLRAYPLPSMKKQMGVYVWMWLPRDHAQVTTLQLVPSATTVAEFCKPLQDLPGWWQWTEGFHNWILPSQQLGSPWNCSPQDSAWGIFWMASDQWCWVAIVPYSVLHW